jgi:penicillin-binding protein 1A
MGITSRLTDNPSEAIGGLKYGVSALQMSDAYATLANGGDHVDPTIISKVIGANGKTIYQNNPGKTTVFSSGEAYAGTQTLETVLQYGTGTSAYYGCPAAGKTGTTSNYTDAWFVGYTPKLSTAVWVGYPNSDVYMNDVNGLGPGYGGTLAAPIWRDFMQSASDGYCGAFPQPSEYWQGDEYFGPHAVSAYVPPVTTTTTTTSTSQGGNGITSPGTTSTPSTTTTPVNSTPGPPPPASGAGGF